VRDPAYRDKAQGERSARFAHGEQINRRTVGPEPSRILPTRPHHNVCASFEDFADAVGLQIGTIADSRCSS
jgi:hypothetical protein